MFKKLALLGLIFIGAVVVAGFASSTVQPCEPTLGVWCDGDPVSAWLVFYSVIVGPLYIWYLWKHRTKSIERKINNQNLPK